MDYLIKFGLFSIWVSILYIFVDSVVNTTLSYINFNFIPWLDAFGVTTGFNLFFSIIVSCFISKKLITFWQSS